VKTSPAGWAACVDREADQGMLNENALPRTDFNPLKILLAPDRVWITGRAWPTRWRGVHRHDRLPDPGDGRRPRRQLRVLPALTFCLKERQQT
jgi:hypothetical protein